MILKEIINGTADTIPILENILSDIHQNGPINPEHFETLAYIKKFYPDVFKLYESRLTYLLGLFFKTSKPNNLLEAVYSSFSKTIIEQTGKDLTPVQANIYNAILDKKYFSFSAPTSTGKSFIFRELINEFSDDIVVVVPSRALIAEYMTAITSSLGGDKSVLVMQFVENINIANTRRRIYIITPERGGDLFRVIDQLNVKLFLFDEAQVSEENIRGMTFDSFVRRVDKKLPHAKKVFTHPFVANPDAQLNKHNFTDNAKAMLYKQHSVGKIFVSYKAGEFKYFSPYNKDEKVAALDTVPDDLAARLLKLDRTLLIYVSKTEIYKRQHIDTFKKYIDLCPPIKAAKAKKIIRKLRDFIGASEGEGEKHSHLIKLMQRGIVIHHGSIPLKARLLIEEFVNSGLAKICFATSTLIQGVNMPFDAVWIDNFKFYGSDDDKILGMKNLIGRAGRTTTTQNSFDYGYVIVNQTSRKLFSERLKGQVILRNNSALDDDISDMPEDLQDLAEAIQDNTFNSDLNLTETQIQRIKDRDISQQIKFLLDNLIKGSGLITEAQYRELENKVRDQIKESFGEIYLCHLRKDSLSKREKSILSVSISILLWKVQGKSFKEILSLRYSYLARKDEQRVIDRRRKKGELTNDDAVKEKRELKIRYSQQADRLPSSEAGTNTLFNTTDSVLDLDYDKLIYDTYDYLDKVIAQCLVDPITGALKIFYDNEKDLRALTLANYIRYGTNNATDIWLLRYGFEPEDIDWIKKYVSHVDENRIVFSPSIAKLSKKKLNVIDKYL